MTPLLLAALLTAVPPGAAAGAPPGETLYGTRIAALSFEGDAPADTAYWSRLTDLNPGQTLTQGAVRRALRNLFATRRFLDLSLEGTPGPEGTRIVVRFAAAPGIRSLVLAGEKIPEKGRLKDAIGLAPGDLWAPDAGEQVETNVRTQLKSFGRFEAKVTAVVTGASEENAVDVRVEIVPGPQAVAAPPEFVGAALPFPEKDVLKAARVKPGKAYREVRVRADAERFETFLRQKGYGRAEVRWDTAVYDPATRRAAPRYHLFVGPLVVLKVSGVPESEVRKHPHSPWERLQPPDEETVEAFRTSLLETYQKKGYAKARVEVSFDTTETEEIVSFVVEKGDRWAVGRVEIEGAKRVKPSIVRHAVATSPPGLFTRGRLVDSELEADVAALLGVYRGRGFRDVKVDGPDVTPGKRPFTLDVTLRATEGNHYTIASRTITGNKKVSDAELSKGLSTVPGRPFTEEGVNGDVALIGGRYQEKGFVDARVDSTVKMTPGAEKGETGADVGFSILEGDQVRFGKTIVRGNRRTRLDVIQRELGHKEGDPFSLTKALESQRNLAALGVFSRVEIQSYPTDLDTGTRSVVVTVTEGKPWSLLYGIGAEYDSASSPQFSPRVSLGGAYNNLLGRAITVGAEVRYSRRETRERLFIREPFFFDLGFPLTLQVFSGFDFRQGYEVKRGGAYLDTSRKLSEKVKLLFRYQYEIVTPSQDPGLGPDQRQNQQNRVNSIGPALSFDTRDDPVDPKKGFLVSSEFKYAFPLLNATEDFVRASVLAAVFRPLGATTLALAMRVGAIEPLGPCNVEQNPTCQPNLRIAIPERLFAGGRTTHRAFGQDALGVPGQTVNADGVGYGGNGLLLFNVEWRVKAVGDLGLAAFFDAGNVWSDWRNINFYEIRPGAGAGVFYMTPVGPVRLDYGMKLDKKPNESLGTVHFSVGYAF